MPIDASLSGHIVLSSSSRALVGDSELIENSPGENMVTMDHTYSIRKSKGVNVNSAKIMALSVNSQAVTFNGLGQIEPSGQTLIFKVSKQNTTATVVWSAASIGNIDQPTGVNLSNSTGDSVTMSAKQFEAARGSGNGVTVTAKLTDGAIILEERVTILALRSAAVNEPTGADKLLASGYPPVTTAENRLYAGVLTNESHIVASDLQGAGVNFSEAGGKLRLFDGTTDVTNTRGVSYSVANVSNGLEITVDENTGVYSVTALTVDSGSATIRATYDSNTIDGGGDIPAGGIGGSETGSVAAGTAGAGTSPVSGDSSSFVTCRNKYGVSADEATAIQNEGAAHPFGTTPEGLARERAVYGSIDPDADPVAATSNDAKVAPIGCEGCVNASDTYQLSPRFTVHDLSIHCDASPTRIGNGSFSIDPVTRSGRIYGRAEIICNLKHLCVNALEPIFNHFVPLGYTIQITSGYRTGKGDKSDHPKGSAADLRIYYKGQRIGGRHLTRVQMAIDQLLRIPYTQMIFETPSSNGDILHVACRRNGVRSSIRNGWSTGNGHGGSTRSGYKFNVDIGDGPPVK